jgi:hypothetical protein
VTILELALKSESGWTGLIWLNIGACGGTELSSSMKGGEFILQAMPLLAYQEGLYSMDLYRNLDISLDECDDPRTRNISELGKVKLKLTVIQSQEFYLLGYKAV